MPVGSDGTTYPHELVTVSLHRPSRSLTVADFNLAAADLPPVTGQLLRLFGTYDRFAVSRLLRAMIADVAALRRDVDLVRNWDFERGVVEHGRVLEGTDWPASMPCGAPGPG